LRTLRTRISRRTSPLRTRSPRPPQRASSHPPPRPLRSPSHLELPMRLPTSSHALSVVATLAVAFVAPARARAQLAVLSSLVEERTESRGERYAGRITVRNTTRQPQTAKIYQTDFRFAADGTSHTDDPGSSPRSNAPWVHAQMTRLSLPPGAEI